MATPPSSAFDAEMMAIAIRMADRGNGDTAPNPSVGAVIADAATGEVIAPLQSQAGARNFRFGTGAANWWNGEQFAESAFWLHP